MSSSNTADTDAEDMTSVEGTVDATLIDSMQVIYSEHSFTTVKEEVNTSLLSISYQKLKITINLEIFLKCNPIFEFYIKVYSF